MWAFVHPADHLTGYLLSQNYLKLAHNLIHDFSTALLLNMDDFQVAERLWALM